MDGIVRAFEINWGYAITTLPFALSIQRREREGFDESLLRAETQSSLEIRRALNWRSFDFKPSPLLIIVPCPNLPQCNPLHASYFWRLEFIWGEKIDFNFLVQSCSTFRFRIKRMENAKKMLLVSVFLKPLHYINSGKNHPSAAKKFQRCF